MSLMFRWRKYGHTIDSLYRLVEYTGRTDCRQPMDHWMIGDEVSVMFYITRVMAQQINAAGMRDIGVSTLGSVDEKCLVHIPCVVVKRSHSIVWEDVGKFQELDPTSVVLEAKDGYWEDILLWIIMGDSHRPEWVEDPEDE